MRKASGIMKSARCRRIAELEYKSILGTGVLVEVTFLAANSHGSIDNPKNEDAIVQEPKILHLRESFHPEP